MRVQKAAVLGAGVMGAQIAAHLVNAGIPTILYDLPSGQHERSFLVHQAIKSLSTLKPSPLAHPELGEYIEVANFEDHLSLLETCDFVIEVIAEKLEWKQALFKKIAPYLKKQVVLATNTSGLSIETLKQGLESTLQARFLGVHFFNPPRYMRLVELIPHTGTDPILLKQVEQWLFHVLGKGIVIAKDTPNFIGNRIGVFALLSIIWKAEKFEFSPDLVDSLTGPLLGRPKSATFRTMDVVGLDILFHVVKTMDASLKEDPWHKLFRLPEWILQLVEKGTLGQKTKAGIFKKEGADTFVYQAQSGQYRPVQKRKMDPEIQAIFSESDFSILFQKLRSCSKKEALFLQEIFAELFLYSAYHLKEIAYTIQDIDRAMCWGYGWKIGPFELWQRMGFRAVKTWLLEKSPLPQWVMELDPAVGFVFERAATQKPIIKIPSLQVSVLGKEVAVIELTSSRRILNHEMVESFIEVLATAQNDFKGIILSQGEADDFSLGFDLKELLIAREEQKFLNVEQYLNRFQQLMQMIHFSPVPIVAAVRGKCFSAGLELVMHCSARVAHLETYMGFLETSLGLIPAAGGCKELWRRMSGRYSSQLDEALIRAFETIAFAKVSNSAIEAKKLGFLRENDRIIMQKDSILSAAHAVVSMLVNTGYTSPFPDKMQMCGKSGIALLKARMVNLRAGHYINDHDVLVGEKLAEVLSGGTVGEARAFMDLLNTEKTQQRLREQA